MGKGFHLARIAGIDVYLDWSLLIIFTLVTVSLGAGGFPAWHPDWGALTIWSMAVAAAVLFLASVLVHELSHALVGRAHGIEVSQITLFVFGGMAQMREEPHAWRPELWMAIAGPITSLALGAAFIAAGFMISAPLPLQGDDPAEFFASLGPLATLFFWLGPINVILGIFNLVPGFPLDGGRVLRAALWGVTGDMVRATRWASNGGRIFAWLLIGTGFAMALGVSVPIFGTGLVGGLWLALIGWFLNNAAVMSYRQLLVRESLGDVPVSRLMQTSVQSVTPEVSVQSLVEDYVMRADQRAFPVVERERLLGLVCLRDVYKLPRGEWGGTPVERIMTPADSVASVAPTDAAIDALNELSRRQVNQLPVIEHGRIRGMLRREDVLRWLAVYGDRSFQNARS
jgi:Zn-dependent protease/predicted transcriptional regulator